MGFQGNRTPIRPENEGHYLLEQRESSVEEDAHIYQKMARYKVTDLESEVNET